MLTVLNAYDLNVKHQKALLTLAQLLCDWTSTIYTEDKIQSLNLLQIIKRKRTFTTDELTELNHIVETSEDISIKCGGYILLDEYTKVLNCLEELDEKERSEFEKYPIYHFVKIYQQGGGNDQLCS